MRAIARQMSDVVLRTARSGVINSARDFSSALLAGDGRALVIDEGLPVHVGSAHLIPRAVLECFDDIEPGDCFLNNSPFLGNTHHADFTLCCPMFDGDELAFWVMSRAHQADVGAPEPSTYLPFAATVQEEGLHLPCVRVWRHGRERHDVLRLILARVRDQAACYADHLAQVGALRIGTRRLGELFARYGSDARRAFVEDWIDYSERMMAAAIARLPAGTWTVQAIHDPLPFAPDGIPVRATVTVDPDRGRVTVDLRDNVDNVEGGLNLSEATTLAAAYAGVFNNIPADVPRNAGSLARIEVLMREGAVVGIPRRGVGTSVATTNVCDRLVNAVQSAFAGAGAPYGVAEGSTGGPPSFSVISGRDRRYRDRAFVNQTIIGFGGGPGVCGHDGWLTYNKPVAGGVLRVDSVELNELAFPLLYREIALVPDSGGAGTWRGAPGVRTVFGPRFDDMTLSYYGDGTANPPRGVLGGESGGPSGAWRVLSDGTRTKLPLAGRCTLAAGELVESVWAGGGGYGSPRLRDPEAVRQDVEDELVSTESARECFGVAIEQSGTSRAEVNAAATERLRRG
jgi:N-methylhydantoinase B